MIGMPAFFRQSTAAIGTPTTKFQTQFGSLLFGYFIFGL
jgi:hypothetical protein